VKAGSIMQPLSETAIAPGLPEADISSSLQALIDLALQRDAQQLAIVEDGQVVGSASREVLLKAVRGIDVA
jgi:glycine betaine/proline transport system ATP-binding protein